MPKNLTDSQKLSEQLPGQLYVAYIDQVAVRDAAKNKI